MEFFNFLPNIFVKYEKDIPKIEKNKNFGKRVKKNIHIYLLGVISIY
jgi:hypothetical protein